jgi:hypothetical protein
VGAGLANSGLLTAFFRGENPRAMSRPRRMTVLLAAIACLGVPRPPGGFAQPAVSGTSAGQSAERRDVELREGGIILGQAVGGRVHRARICRGRGGHPQ